MSRINSTFKPGPNSAVPYGVEVLLGSTATTC